MKKLIMVLCLCSVCLAERIIFPVENRPYHVGNVSYDINEALTAYMDDGDANGQMLYWYEPNSKWLHTDGLIWNEASNYLTVTGTTGGKQLRLAYGGNDYWDFIVNNVGGLIIQGEGTFRIVRDDSDYVDFRVDSNGDLLITTVGSMTCTVGMGDLINNVVLGGKVQFNIDSVPVLQIGDPGGEGNGAVLIGNGTDLIVCVSPMRVDGALIVNGGITSDFDVISFNDSNLATTGTISGVNVTSGVNPGHTHSIYLTSESDTLASVVARGANAGATINVGAGNTLSLASGSITDTSGTISFSNENISTTGKGTYGEIAVDTIGINGSRISGTSTIYVDSEGYEIVQFSYADGILFNYGMSMPLGYPIHFCGTESDCWIVMEDEYRLDLKSAGEIRLNTPITKTKDIQPLTDNAYYLGYNNDDTPFAWKGVILKDTTNGKYYRIEVINGVITATDLTD